LLKHTVALLVTLDVCAVAEVLLGAAGERWQPPDAPKNTRAWMYPTTKTRHRDPASRERAVELPSSSDRFRGSRELGDEVLVP
jgi:hypothetical protein